MLSFKIDVLFCLLVITFVQNYLNMKVLIVDDEKDILEFLSYNLEKEGFIVHTALNGKSAI